MYKRHSALNNQQWLICYKTQPNPNRSAVDSVSTVLKLVCVCVCVCVCVKEKYSSQKLSKYIKPFVTLYFCHLWKPASEPIMKKKKKNNKKKKKNECKILKYLIS